MYLFDFSFNEYQELLKKCPFSDEEISIIEARRIGKTNTQICMDLCLSQATLSRRIKKILKKIQKEI